ncbi:crotonase/enoyl-CoA hydratase family protein [Nocardioides deserti]|uniref:Crotonase/enoyl-CoA hydratase family protein n=1 Tax=Nocardioides deserti TaxID=1588644 RepID=A0ABR6UBS6_9ACTN|nr:crotonase/enoyl-CoA hydratase family protein [Nocardioides deserti]MBC2961889.1 crotonase/enoyl-CoA hydratase family protein [Nocardioides deserti]GGO79593.1 putative enoyl-CoA hydratase/isomerase [Nocardioides deserti]
MSDPTAPVEPVEPVVLVERRDRVLVVTLNRPHAKNAVNAEVSAAVAAAMDELDADDGLSVGVITGAGGTFCAGMDLKAFLTGEDVMAGGRGLAGLTTRPPAKPLVAAVEGWALAGGCEVVLACDVVVASRDAKLGIPEVKRGLVAGAGGLVRLPRKIPQNVANELALTGDPMTAEQAERYGLVNRLTEPGGALEAALELAARMTANGPLAMAATKRILAEQADWSSTDVWDRQSAILGPVFASEDAQEGARAFAEKRAPQWRNR